MSHAYRPAKTLVLVLTVLLLIQVVLYGFFTLLDSLGVTVLAEEVASEVPEGAALGYIALYAILGLVMLVVSLVTAVCFFIWLHRANRNARALGAEGMKFTPGWCVGWFFVPFMNLVRPYQVVREIYQASEPGATGEDWKQARIPPVLAWWWATYLLSSLLGQFEMRTSLAGEAGLQQISSWVGIVSSIFGIAATLLAVHMIRSIHQRQESKARQAREVEASPEFAFAGES
jgi:hypothetical protein